MPGEYSGSRRPDRGAVPVSEETVAITGLLEQPPGEEPAHGGTGRRALWTLADQAMVSLTNAALSLMVAGAVTRIDFGAFSLAVITYGFVIGFARALIGEPFVVRFSAVDDATRAAGAVRAAGAALVYGLLAGLICLVVALLTGGPTQMAFLALALSLPGLAVSDFWRYIYFAAQRPSGAALIDFVWAALQFGGLGFLLLTDRESILVITLVWGASATVAALVGGFRARLVPQPSAAWRWMVEVRDLNVQLGIGYVANQGALQVGYYSVGGIVGVAGVGALRAAQVLLGPLNLFFAGFNSFILPVLARRVAEGKRLLTIAVLGSLTLGGVTAVWLTVMLLLPDSVGVRLLGDSWEGARTVMLPSGLVMIGLALALGASNSLVSMSRTDLMLRITAVQAPLILVLGVLGAARWGAEGAAWGFATAQAIGVTVCWFLFLRADARPGGGRPAAGRPAAGGRHVA